jgi:DNA polymerase-3 subunit epsilon
LTASFLLAPKCVFVDLETTGATATRDRITEIGIVRVVNGEVEEEWSTLVNPETGIPPEIQYLTGISNAMVADAPTFAEIRQSVLERLEGHLFIAHNARFDYGFIKNEFRRAGARFSADVLCTVRLSRKLYPEHRRHGLDALIERHGLSGTDRHRALGDARMIWEFVRAASRDKPSGEIEQAVRQLLKTPSLPPQLAPDALQNIPESPGVYLFYGLNALPLYIGKSKNLRERVRAHFSSDHASANDLRLSAEVTHIEFEETTGELGALLRESQLVKTLLPHHNQRLRHRSGLCALRLGAEPGPPELVKQTSFASGEVDGLYGPFASRQAAKRLLMDLAGEHGLCWVRLGLERREGACFAHQIERCRGACVGAETEAEHHARLRAALAHRLVLTWPFDGPIGLRESSQEHAREEVHLFDRWCHLGTARTDGEIDELLDASRPSEFDLDVYQIVRAFVSKPRPNIRLVQLPHKRDG